MLVDNGTTRSNGADLAQRLDRERGSACPSFVEHDTLLADLATNKVIEMYPCARQSRPPVEKECRNGPPVASATLIGGVVRTVTRQSWPLRAAQVRVEELASANRRKDEFLAMVSHELRSPLASIRYAVRLVGRQLGEAPAQQHMQALIERQIGRMTRLVDELLDVSRITNGHLHLQCERIDLRVVLSNTIETLEADIIERRHRLATELPDAPVWLQADPGRLEQVFVNLLANASKYTSAGGELAVWVHRKEGEVVVRVRDSGIGIAPDAMPHIFDLFRQANTGDSRSKAGLGIGLAVVRKLVELHGGSVTAASAGSGHGSEFTVRLPTAERPGCCS